MSFLYGFDFKHIINFMSNNFGIKNFWDVLKIILDLGLVTYVVYKLVILVRETRAWQLIKGILIILFAAKISGYLGLKTLAYLMDNAVQYIAIALVVIFQPELRRALEKIGRSRFKEFLNFDEHDDSDRCALVVDEIVEAVMELSKAGIGALIVFERQTRIGEVINSGVRVDAVISSKLLVNVFTPNTPLHDGAVVIREGKMKAAGCLLPLSDNPAIGKNLGTRHRAAIGITETTDAVAVVVSEETSRISISSGGRLQIGVDKQTLKERLCNIIIDERQDGRKLHIWKVRHK